MYPQSKYKISMANITIIYNKSLTGPEDFLSWEVKVKILHSLVLEPKDLNLLLRRIPQIIDVKLFSNNYLVQIQSLQFGLMSVICCLNILSGQRSRKLYSRKRETKIRNPLKISVISNQNVFGPEV